MNKKNSRIGVIIVIAAVAVVYLLKSMHPLQTAGLKSGGAGKEKGPQNAPITLVEYSDFQCPACGAAQTTLHDLLAKYPDKIHMIYRHFPLKMHQWSELAHQCAECASEQGKFWDFHDRLFLNQATWAKAIDNLPTFLGYATEMGLNMDTFGKCLSGEEAKNKVSQDRMQGDALQINSTPTFFINGERIVGPMELKTRGEDMMRKILGLPPLEVPAAATSPAVTAPPVAAPPASSPAPAPEQTAAQ